MELKAGLYLSMHLYLGFNPRELLYWFTTVDLGKIARLAISSIYDLLCGLAILVRTTHGGPSELLKGR